MSGHLIFIPGLGLPELLIILVIVVVIFGASRLPQASQSKPAG